MRVCPQRSSQILCSADLPKALARLTTGPQQSQAIELSLNNKKFSYVRFQSPVYQLLSQLIKPCKPIFYSTIYDFQFPNNPKHFNSLLSMSSTRAFEQWGPCQSEKDLLETHNKLIAALQYQNKSRRVENHILSKIGFCDFQNKNDFYIEKPDLGAQKGAVNCLSRVQCKKKSN